MKLIDKLEIVTYEDYEVDPNEWKLLDLTVYGMYIMDSEGNRVDPLHVYKSSYEEDVIHEKLERNSPQEDEIDR